MIQMLNRVYAPIWNKYRPAILKMMIDSADEPQAYKLSPHEFRAMNDRHKGTFNFTLQLSKGRAINNIRDSMVAQDLLDVLQLSRKASELAEVSAYEISLDKNFVLHVQKMN
jgi:hypothetical protein